MHDTLCHWGVRGMKWGVRRYQNKDGTLTDAGKKRYYTDHGFLTNEGRKQRDANNHKIYQESQRIKSKIANDPEYKKASDALKKSRKENSETYVKERESWLNGTDFKNMDYYQFKDAAYDRWIGSEAGKRESDRLNAMRKVIEKKVREEIGDDAFNQKVPELNASSWTKTLGKDYVDRILNLEKYS